MASETINYKLRKPAEDDFYDVQDFNGNMELIDGALKGNADGIRRAAGVKRISLPASGWSAAVPYTQTVAVAEMCIRDRIWTSRLRILRCRRHLRCCRGCSRKERMSGYGRFKQVFEKE